MIAARTRTALIALALGSANAFPGAAGDDPRLAPGRDPGGTAVAILADGFDYTKPELAAVLARDGEGEAIAWDAVDEDGRPYRAESRGTTVALAATARGGVRIVPVRVEGADAASLARGIAFAVATPAKVVFAPDAASETAGRDVLAAAAQKFEAVLFVASRPATAPADKTWGDGTQNLVLLEADAQGRATAADTIARMLGCGQGALEGASGADLKTAFLSRMDAAAPAQCAPEPSEKSEKP